MAKRMLLCGLHLSAKFAAMYRKIPTPSPELLSLQEELIDLRVRHVLLKDLPNPDFAELAAVRRRLAEVEKLIGAQRKSYN
jgi:hypothetical protein